MALSPTEESLVRQLIAQNPALLNLASSESTIISKLGATKVSLSDLSAATSLSDADLALVRQGLNDKSFAMSVLRDYVAANIPTASTTTKGIVELATNTETQTGADAVRAVTPAGLASVTATEARAGLLEIATTAEAQALTDDTRALTPKKLADALDATAIGRDQTWQDVKANRAHNTTYTNTTDRPIEVIVSGNSGSTIVMFNVNGVPVANFTSIAAGTVESNVSIIIPAGATYGTSGGAFTINRWFELRG